MISTNERQEWLKTLEKHKLVSFMHQNSGGQEVWLNLLASVAAWAAPILDRISDFFPLYTPHNYSLHISTVIDTLDWIMPDTLKREIEKHELFCLLAACLTHDVGMAVSQKEVVEMSKDVHFQKFKAEVEDEIQKQVDEDNLKRMWIRNCHHERSAITVLKFFEDMGDPELGLAISMIVRGHCTDAEQILEDENSFPSQYPIGSNRRVNIPALISYLRLADIFDCTRSRTPWVLYDFLDPNDKNSREEWNRHIAMLAISQDEKRERIIASAKTDDSNVFLRLRRYERIAKSEIESCQRILRLQPNRYRLDLRTFDLHVVTVGFEPVEWLFTINREAVLELLMGNSLYSDPTTCVREILQNSVDACRQRAKLESNYKPKIHISLYSNAKGLYLECKDNGIGMSSEIVEKFLLKVGQRYHESQFYKALYTQQKRIEPTAKFGIGFLSGFMLGDYVSIKTGSEKEAPFSLEFQGPTGYIIKKRCQPDTPQGTSVKIKVSRILENDFDLVGCVKKFVGLLEIPTFVYDMHHPKGVKIKQSDRPSTRTDLFAVFNPPYDVGLKGYVQTAEEKATPKCVISQLGFRIPVENVLPAWAKNFSQVIDLSGDSKVDLTASREKICNPSELTDIEKIVSRKILESFFDKFAQTTPTIDNLRKSWGILRRHIEPTTFMKMEDNKALNNLLLSLYLAGYAQGKRHFLNLNELKQQKQSINILPTWVNPSQNSMERLAEQDHLFICAGSEFGYDRWIHFVLKTFLNATGMPVWIPSEETHAWEYKPQHPNYGWYYKGKAIEGTYTIDVNSYDVEFDVLAPDIYTGHSNSPFILLKSPFHPNSLFFNSTRLASLLPKDKNAKVKDTAVKLVEDVINAVKEAVSEQVRDDLETDLPWSGSGSIYYDYQVVDIDTIIKLFYDSLDEIEIELSDNLIEPNLNKDG